MTCPNRACRHFKPSACLGPPALLHCNLPIHSLCQLMTHNYSNTEWSSLVIVSALLHAENKADQGVDSSDDLAFRCLLHSGVNGTFCASKPLLSWPQRRA